MFLRRSLEAAVSALALRGGDLMMPRSPSRPAPNAARRGSKYRGVAGQGSCRLSIWSGVKKRMRAARRDVL